MLFDPSMPAIPRILTRQWSAELIFSIVDSSSGGRAMRKWSAELVDTIVDLRAAPAVTILDVCIRA